MCSSCNWTQIWQSEHKTFFIVLLTLIVRLQHNIMVLQSLLGWTFNVSPPPQVWFKSSFIPHYHFSFFDFSFLRTTFKSLRCAIGGEFIFLSNWRFRFESHLTRHIITSRYLLLIWLKTSPNELHQVSSWSKSSLISGDDSSYSWVLVCALGLSWRRSYRL